MICPKCGEYATEGVWCARCGTRLKPEDNFSDTVGTNGEYISSQHYYNRGNNSYSAHNRSNDGKSSSKGLKIALAILCPIMLILIIFSSLLAFGVIDFGKEDNAVVSDASEIQAKTEYDTLLKQAMNNIKIGDYQEAETNLKELMQLNPENEDITTLCKIVFNYNQSLKAFKNEDIRSAREFFDKIPIEYMDYVMSGDIDSLEEDIEDWEYSYAAFSEIKGYMESENYDDAELAISLLDESCLSRENAEKLKEYIDTIEKESAKKEKDSDEDEDSNDEKTENTSSLSKQYAESVISSYCAAYVSAVNSGDFSHLSQYITGDLYASQKKMVESCVKDGITMDLDYVKLNSLKEVSKNKWTAKVSEGETIYYADGTVKSKAFGWTYTIEYINGRYYLTKIE